MLEISFPRNPPGVVSERKHCQPLAVPEISSQIGGITTRFICMNHSKYLILTFKRDVIRSCAIVKN